ncbi:MAG TPA: hypothetical protein VFC47_02540 [Caulobacteraceae bacterium]|nr:hypothetical protein [Caulobacteraceae bacterium]
MTISGHLIVVVGMIRESRIIGDGPMIVFGRNWARTLARGLERPGAAALSFGICGGLDPELKPGDLVVGRAVANGETRLAADPAWSDALAALLPGASRDDVLGQDAMVAGAEAKTDLRLGTGAAVVDMESHVVARLAAQAGRPFAVLRAVADGAGHALPRAAQVGLKENGDADVGAVLRALLARPGDLGALIRTARGAGAAFRALAHARHLLGPGLGCPYLGEHLVDVAGEHEVG